MRLYRGPCRQFSLARSPRRDLRPAGRRLAGLRLSHGDVHTLVVEFLAQPPSPGAVVIGGLLPVTAKLTIRDAHGTVAVKAMGQANEVTAQILH